MTSSFLSIESQILPAYEHQKQTVEKSLECPRLLNLSDPGTGKTRATLDGYNVRPNRKRGLVLAPLSILETAWQADAAQYTPRLKTVVAYAKNRAAAFGSESDLVITNHDAVKWIMDQVAADKRFLDEFDELIIDEATAYKNVVGPGGSQRAKAIAALRQHFEHRRALTGTFTSNHILDSWGMAYIIDDGVRLGQHFYRFRDQVCTAKQVGREANMVQWVEKPGALDMVVAQLADISIRFRREDCVDIPKNNKYYVYTELPRKVMDLYRQMRDDSIMAMQSGQMVNAVHAGARATKLLQICTGAVYDSDKIAQLIHTERYRLITDLIQERDWPCLVAFNWRHEREQLVELAEAAGFTYGIIDGDTKVADRVNLINQYQDGKIKVIYAHPASAAHGITLTAGRTTIWASPTANAEHFIQLNARQDRNGQKYETETLMIAAKGTREEHVYELLQGKVQRVNTALQLFVDMQEDAAA